MLRNDVAKPNRCEVDEGKVETFKRIQIVAVNVSRGANAWKKKKQDHAVNDNDASLILKRLRRKIDGQRGGRMEGQIDRPTVEFI